MVVVASLRALLSGAVAAVVALSRLVAARLRLVALAGLALQLLVEQPERSPEAEVERLRPEHLLALAALVKSS